MRRAKIVCTIGPASSSKKKIKKMIMAGMNVARINFSHGTLQEHRETIKLIRDCSRTLQSPVAILQDLRGLKIRVGSLRKNTLSLRKGATVTITQSQGQKSDSGLPIPYLNLRRDVRIGNHILINDGLIKLRVTGRNKNSLHARVIEGGIVEERKGVNLPETIITGKVFTKKDQDDLAFGIRHGVDFVAMSFIRSAEDVLTVKRWLKRRKTDIPVIAKIENALAVNNIDEIIRASDGVMVARGDLGVEVPLDLVPVLQKDIIKKCTRTMKTVITATQMLESMTEHMSPTRAEVTDVANAVIDGSDALMLSAETSIGEYPLEAVRMMHRIISTTENHTHLNTDQQVESTEFTQALAEAACSSAQDIKARTIVTFSKSGFTALLVSKHRPPAPITGFTASEKICRRMNLYWGVSPYIMKYPENTDAMIAESDRALRFRRIVKKGDAIVIIASSPFTMGKTSNILKLHKVGY